MTSRGWVNALLTATILTLAGCGGGDGSSSSGSGNTGSGDNGGGGTTTPTNASPGGIWRGTDSISGLQVLAFVDASGDFHVIRTDGVQYVGSVQVDTNSVTATFDADVLLGTGFVDGSTHGTGSATGTLYEQTSLSLYTQFHTDGGTNSSGTINLTFDPLYERASSLATISGNYTSGNTVISVDSSGAIFSQDPSTSCVVNGTASVIDPTHDIYRVQYTYANCTGSESALNGISFTGFGTLDNTVSPEHLTLGLTGTAGNTSYSIVVEGDRS